MLAFHRGERFHGPEAQASQELVERLAVAERRALETPIIRLDDETVDLYAKLEYLNSVGSIKDRPALWMLKRAIERGQVHPGTTIIESSSGNLARALAAFCKILGLSFIPVIDPCVSPLNEAFLRAHCQVVVKVAEQADDAGGYLKTRLQVVSRLLAERAGSVYWTNQYANPDAMEAHYLLTAGEICRRLPDVDYVFIGVSSAGTVAGVSQRLKEHNPAIRIVAVDAEGSVIFGQRAKKRRIPGLGSSIRPSLLDQAAIDDVVIVKEAETVDACHLLLERHGLFAGGSTGTVYSAIRRYFPAKGGGRRPRVLFFCCDRGEAYLHNVYAGSAPGVTRPGADPRQGADARFARLASQRG
jgi:2,3-diaminopropionate biosynthesis protein SbnA